MAHSEPSRQVVLAIGGYDPSSGAGITADLKTIAAHGFYGTSCLTAITVQSSQGVFKVAAVQPDLVGEILDALHRDSPPAAVKIGMLATAQIASQVAEYLQTRRPRNVVLDPVLRSSSGATLLNEEGFRVLRKDLLGLVDVVTPNLDEAAALTGLSVTNQGEMERACAAIQRMGARNVVVKGGHLARPADVLMGSSTEMVFQWFQNERIDTRNTHGTGCAYASSMACWLAEGRTLPESAIQARDYVAQALAKSYAVGQGAGPINHFHSCRPKF